MFFKSESIGYNIFDNLFFSIVLSSASNAHSLHFANFLDKNHPIHYYLYRKDVDGEE